ncbi:luciferin 4-monooxygenase-like [Danaus plexippus]|uniref:luciferin 4-monooxygenase-like n=1 Tax=Danaus plexippus TaxID=13037 RepID=UPI002AAF74CC|nr:luciferin 4-monooxygenase-like [Danaus plexippus]
MAPTRINDAVHWYMSNLTSRIIARTGIPSDRYHMGKVILQCLKDYPEAVTQIDGATGESETNETILERSVKCATSFRKFGLQSMDVIVLMAPNHIHLCIPFYAALYTGNVIAAVDFNLGKNELQQTLAVLEPKIIFCQSSKAPTIQLALNEIDSNAFIVAFDKGHYLCDFDSFIDKFYDGTTIDEFEPTDFDPEEATAFLVSTSGTTGLPKAAEVTHKNFLISLPNLFLRYTEFPTPTKMALVGSPLQWLTALFNYVASAIFKYTRLQSSLPLTKEHAYYLFHTYKPTFSILSPTLITSLLKNENKCDFSSFEFIMLGGSAVPASLIEEIKNLSPNTEVINVYGMSEISSIAFMGDYGPPDSCGRPLGVFYYRLIDTETQEDILEPNRPGELWVKGPSVFKGYYKNKEATEEAFAEDGWFKTGDMFYRDENWNYYFLERIKLLLKYKSDQISPVEVENVIRQVPGVVDVAVAGLPDPECGDIPVACVVIQNGATITADDIKNIVRDKLSDSKQLRGGVIFLDSIPMTASTKVHRRKLKEIVMSSKRL